jgi:membrane protein implicated in regulation of membrane protease activity
MPILPIIDLLIFSGWTLLFIAFALKAIYLSTSYKPMFFSLGPLELVIMAAVMLLFALTLAARTWVKSHEDKSAALARRAEATMEAFTNVQRNVQNGTRSGGDGSGDDVRRTG